MQLFPRIQILDVKSDIDTQLQKTFDTTIKLCDSVDEGNVNDICADALGLIQLAMGVIRIASESKLDNTIHLMRHELKIKQQEAYKEEKILGWINLVEKEY